MFVASNVVALSDGVGSGLVSLGIGLLGVALARWVFVNREVRRTAMREGWKETLPLTLVAMLITGVMIIDHDLPVSASAFLGLGVGWAAVLLLDILGERILATFRGALSSGPPAGSPVARIDASGNDGKVIDADVHPTPEMVAALKLLDRQPSPRSQSGYHEKGHVPTYTNTNQTEAERLAMNPNPRPDDRLGTDDGPDGEAGVPDQFNDGPKSPV